MRRLFGWMAGLVGLAALARYLARRERAQPLATSSRPESDPAVELRRKLAESRTEPDPSRDSPVAPVPSAAAPESLAERRARVHAKAEAAIAEMQEPP